MSGTPVGMNAEDVGGDGDGMQKKRSEELMARGLFPRAGFDMLGIALSVSNLTSVYNPAHMSTRGTRQWS